MCHGLDTLHVCRGWTGEPSSRKVRWDYVRLCLYLVDRGYTSTLHAPHLTFYPSYPVNKLLFLYQFSANIYHGHTKCQPERTGDARRHQDLLRIQCELPFFSGSRRRCTTLTRDKRIASQRGRKMYVGTKTFCNEMISAYTAVFPTVTSPRSVLTVNRVKRFGFLYR